MAELRGGPTMHVQFVHSGGTMVFAEQYRNVTLSDEADMIDTTAGALTFREFIVGLRNWTCSVEALFNGTASPFGTADDFVLVAGAAGTLTVSPLGTTSGSIKYSGAVIANSRQREWPYDDVVPFNAEFQGNGTLTMGTWA